MVWEEFLVCDFSNTKPVTSAAEDSLHISGTPTVWSCDLRTVESISAEWDEMRWISRLYSFQPSPPNPHSAIPETTTTSPCLLFFKSVPGIMKLNVLLLLFDYHIPPCVVDVFSVIFVKKKKEKSAERQGSVQYQKCCRRCFQRVRRVFNQSVLLVSLSVFWLKRN